MEKNTTLGLFERQRPQTVSSKACLAFILSGSTWILWTVLLGVREGNWSPLPWRSPTSEPSAGTCENSEAFWDHLPTYKHLEYTPCYEEGLQCARLALPMDYWNDTAGDATVSLAVIKKPAAVPVTDPRYGGAVLVNPGGPGGSGVDYAHFAWANLRRKVDSAVPVSESSASSGAKYFDFIGFDPRGVLRSKPAVNTFNDPLTQLLWAVRESEEGVFDVSDAAFGRLWSMSAAHFGSFALPPESGPNVKQHVTTAHVATDMVQLIEAHGQWREEEARRLLYGSGLIARAKTVASDIVPDSLKYRPGAEKIYYYGGSYGTYLGMTYAAMYPNKIHRLVVDGVVDAYDYRKVLWYDNLVDTEKDLDAFYYNCARVGYPACALANETEATTAEGVEATVNEILNSLWHNPLPIVQRYNPGVISYSDVKTVIFQALYTPVQLFPFVANLLANIRNGNVSAQAIEPLMQQLGISPTAMNEDTRLANLGVSQDATAAIACSDGESQTHITKPAFQKYYHKLMRLSPSIGAIWAKMRMNCVHYDVRPFYRFTAPWEAETSHPILFIGNTADPVTPLSNAHKMSKGFPGSVVLTQNSPGHCSGSTYSACTFAKIRDYFQTGSLPEPGTVCQPDLLPFGPTPEEDVEATETVVDAEVLADSEKEAMFLAGVYRGIGGGVAFQ